MPAHTHTRSHSHQGIEADFFFLQFILLYGLGSNVNSLAMLVELTETNLLFYYSRYNILCMCVN